MSLSLHYFNISLQETRCKSEDDSLFFKPTKLRWKDFFFTSNWNKTCLKGRFCFLKPICFLHQKLDSKPKSSWIVQWKPKKNTSRIQKRDHNKDRKFETRQLFKRLWNTWIEEKNTTIPSSIILKNVRQIWSKRKDMNNDETFWRNNLQLALKNHKPRYKNLWITAF